MGQKRNGRAKSKTLVVITAFAALVAVSGTSAQAADQYDDQDSHPLRVVSYFLYPVGTVIDYAVFRPLHFVGRYLTPSNDNNYDMDAKTCQGERINRLCQRNNR